MYAVFVVVCCVCCCVDCRLSIVHCPLSMLAGCFELHCGSVCVLDNAHSTTVVEDGCVEPCTPVPDDSHTLSL